MIGDSFEFRGINFREQFGIRVVKTDVLMPRKRKRKTNIPRRHGSFDHGAENWEDRIIEIECDLLRKLTRDQTREIAYLLSEKGRLILWDEPDKYYIGEIYDSPEILDFQKQIFRNFTLVFECEPFAYREAKSIEIKNGSNAINYDGTVAAPAKITLTNTGNTTIDNILLNLTSRR